MPIYSYSCPRCGKAVDKIRKMSDTSPVHCDCQDTEDQAFAVEMKQVPAVPSPMQWGCKRF